MLSQETEASSKVVRGSETNPGESKASCASGFLMAPIFSHYSLPLPVFRFWHSGLKKHSTMASLCYRKESKRVFFRYSSLPANNATLACFAS